MADHTLLTPSRSTPADYALRFEWDAHLDTDERVEIVSVSVSSENFEGLLYRDDRCVARSRNNFTPEQAEADLWNAYHSLILDRPVPSLSGMVAGPLTVHSEATDDCRLDLRLLDHGPAYGYYACLSCRWTELGYATWDFEYLTTVPWPDGAYCSCRKRDDTGLYLFIAAVGDTSWHGVGVTRERAEQNAFMLYLETVEGGVSA